MGLLLCFHHYICTVSLAVHSPLIPFYLNLLRSRLEHYDSLINIQLQCLWVQSEAVLLWNLIDLIKRDKVTLFRLNSIGADLLITSAVLFFCRTRAAPPSFPAYCEFVLNSNPINLCHLNTAFLEKTFSSLVREIFFFKFP